MPPPDALRAALPRAMGLDADVFRAALEITNCLALPQEVFARPGMAERVLTAPPRRTGAGRPARPAIR